MKLDGAAMVPMAVSWAILGPKWFHGGPVERPRLVRTHSP